MQLANLVKSEPFKKHVVHPDDVPLGNNNFSYQPWASQHKPNPTITPARLLFRAKEALFWLHHNSGNSPFGFVFEDGTYELFPSNECLGLINCSERICSDKPVAYFVSAYKHIYDTPEAVEFCDWLINRSPFSENFLTKDPKKAIKEGVILKTDNCVAFVVASVAAFRYLSDGEVYDNWCMWKKHVPEDIAFIFAHYLKKDYIDGGKYYQFSDAYEWHSIIAKNIGIDGIKRFVTRDYSLHDKTPMRDKPYRYGDFSHLWRTRDEKVHVPFKPKGKDVTVTSNGYWGTQTFTHRNLLDASNMQKLADDLLKEIGYPYAAD